MPGLLGLTLWERGDFFGPTKGEDKFLLETKVLSWADDVLRVMVDAKQSNGGFFVDHQK